MTVSAATAPATRPEPSAADVKRAEALGQLESALAALDRAQSALYAADASLPHAFTTTARTHVEHAITAAR